ncbi:MAG: RimK/LysX family protein [Desulfobaccales bacterium]
MTIERALLRWAPIKRHNQEPQRRPVITLGLCLGNIYKETEVLAVWWPQPWPTW